MKPACPSESASACAYGGYSTEPLSDINPCTSMPHSDRLNASSIDGLSTPLSNSLSTERVSSSIPKQTNSEGLPEQTWQYPSPRMFYHALLRKGYDTDSKDIESMLFIHNQLNEGVWEKVLEWESFIQASRLSKKRCPSILKSFRGRASDLSPMAWFAHTFLGADRPFDRHDWVVDRCGRDVRYVIDYYEGFADNDGSPTMNVNVRPALDSFSALYHRVRKYLTKN